MFLGSGLDVAALTWPEEGGVGRGLDGKGLAGLSGPHLLPPDLGRFTFKAKSFEFDQALRGRLIHKVCGLAVKERAKRSDVVNRAPSAHLKTTYGLDRAFQVSSQS